MTGAFQSWGKIDLTSMGDAFELQYPCFAVRNAPWQVWLPGSGLKPLKEASYTAHQLVSKCAKAALCTIPWVANVRFAPKLKDIPR